MNEQKDRIVLLLEHYATKTATQAEENELFSIIADAGNEQDIKNHLLQLQEMQQPSTNFDRTQWEPILQSILGKSFTVVPEETPIRRIYNWKKIAVAASILLIIGLGTAALVGVFTNKKEQNDIAKTIPADVQAPQATKATITLADGRTVTLDSAASGTLATQGNINVIKTADGQIVYETASGEIIKEIKYNTLENPRGSKVIDMTLSDGSHVWLNAGSSVTYPVAFIGNERKVSITGEAYFEVAHNVKKPFKVTKGGMEVTVLGTHFNVNAYDDESDIKVTLLEGSVEVKSEKSKVKIKPGEQAVAIDHSPFTIHHPDLEQVMAWKNGKFHFADATIDAVMKQLARWYDVEIVYEGDKPSVHFIGDISRMENMSQVLKMLEQTQAVRFSIEGKKIIVKKY